MMILKIFYLMVFLLLTACGGSSSSSGGSDSVTDPAPGVDPPTENTGEVRVYQLGDIVEFSGTLSRAVGSGAPVESAVSASMEFMENVYSHEDKTVLAVQTKVTVLHSGEEISTTRHIWQEADGALFDLTDEYGKYFMDSATNEYGLPVIPVPLMSFAEGEYQFYTMWGGHTSTPITMGERSLRVAEEETLAVPLGEFRVHAVTFVDDYSYLVSYDEHKRDESVIDERSNYVSQEMGIVGFHSVYRQYSPGGELEATVVLDLEATSVNF